MKQTPGLILEQAFWKQGLLLVAGVDEAGRGAWAGPVMAGAVILPNDPEIADRLAGVRDSKQMTARERERMAVVIQEQSICWAVEEASNQEIDQMGILKATQTAMMRALEQLTPAPQSLLVDFVRLKEVSLPQQCPSHGDNLSLSIAAASILAKVTRDRWMCEQAEVLFPQYGFSRHKGYGTRIHAEALENYGCCSLHRKTFRPVARELRLFD
ncbi:MAG: ribonuclease HII [Chloroflexi bacterium]|nr:ribonuclease HII [Chloroflexota bacterium]